MGIYTTINKLQILAINTKMVNMCSFGDIMLFDNKATIKYPYVNIDVVNASVTNFVQTYTFRIYVCDRNEPYIAYNKAETILNTFLKNNAIDITNYTINYFTLNFKDIVNGVWADIIIQVPLVTECDTFIDLGEGYITQQNDKFILNESNDLIKTE